MIILSALIESPAQADVPSPHSKHIMIRNALLVTLVHSAVFPLNYTVSQKK